MGSYLGVRTMFSGLKNVIKGTGGLARSVYRSAALVICEAAGNFADGFF